MRICGVCDTKNEDERDFCKNCGDYLHWDPTTVVATVPAIEGEPPGGDGPTAEAPTAPEPARPADAVLLTLRLPEAQEPPPGELLATVDPGGQASLVALVRNQSGIVDNYDLSVAGFPEQWWTITPRTVYLVPYGSLGGTYEQEVMVTFTPPRTPEAEARPWPVHVIATSRAREAEAARVPATLTITPFHELQTELRPQRAKARLRARYAVGVRNRGNADTDIELTGQDDEEALRFAFDKSRFQTTPGRRGGSPFTVRPRRQIWIGRAVEHRFEITPRALEAPTVEPPVQGFLRQRPWIPFWMLILIPLAAAAVITLIALEPGKDRMVAVPDLTQSADMLAAQSLLDEAGLTLGNRYTDEEATGGKPGAILSQTPAPQTIVKEGTPVAVNIAPPTGPATIRVPKVIGLTLPQAVKRLVRRKLQVGKMLSEPADRATPIGFQAPDPGTAAHAGDPVDVDFKAPPAAGTAPAVAGLGVAAAVAELAKAKVPYVVRRELSATVPVGDVIRQVPAEGGKIPEGGQVELFVSAGNPWIALDNERDVLALGAAAGAPLKPVAATKDSESQPSWNATGTLVAYRRTPAGTPQPAFPTSPGRIWVTNRDTGKARPLTDAGYDDRRPAFSPDGRVVAFVSNRPTRGGGDFNLCFQRIQPITIAPTCVAGPGYSVSRPAWSPDGRAILLDAERLGQGRSELLLYTSTRANSPNPAHWTLRGIVTEAMHVARAGDQVRSVAWSPDGGRVAFSANWRRGVFRLYMSRVIGRRLAMAKPVGRLTACELSWSPSQLGQLVVSQRDPTTCEGPGQLVRVNPADPGRTTVLSPVGVGNPAWHPGPATLP
jgi:beta-lactam-binding protein with PASTA domain